MKKFLLLPLLLLALSIAFAGPLDDLKQNLKDQAQQAKDDAAQKAQDAANDAAQKEADKSDDGAKSTDAAPPADDAAKPADDAAAAAPAESPAPADNPPDTSTASAPAPDQAAAAPALPVLTVELRTSDPRGDDVTPTAPITELATWAPQLFVTAKGHATNEDSFDFTVRLVADNVPGIPHGLVVAPPPMDSDGERLDSDSAAKTIPLNLPRALLPGLYRVEIIEPDPPNRVAASAGLVVPTPVPGAEAFNLSDPEFGGLVERVSEEDGAGRTWAPSVLGTGNQKVWNPVARADAAPDSDAPELPCELVISFFQRQPALVARVEIVATQSDYAPREVEVWGSMQSAADGFTRLADATLEDGQSSLAITVPPTQVRFLKVRFVSKQNSATLALTGIRVLEGQAPGYEPLLKRFPDMTSWRVQPRHAAQQGIYYLSASAVEFQVQKDCMGCHVQSQALMGISIAARNDYVISHAAQKVLSDYALRSQNDEGDFARTPEHGEHDEPTTTIFAALGLTYAPTAPGADAPLLKAARWLAAHQNADGSMPTSDERLPVTQGAIIHTSNTVDAWAEVLKSTDDPALRAALARGMTFIRQADAATTQDRVFKALAFLRHGDDALQKQAHQICAQLLQEQRPDGGWPLETEPDAQTSVFATGEVLYVLRTAGFSVGSPAFQRGVRYLIFQQKADGSWQEKPETSEFASTMWPVIALAGSFTTKLEPAHLTVTALSRPLPPPPAPPPVAAPVAVSTAALPQNLELILDCSGSMNFNLGRSTRIDTAKQVLYGLIAKLPGDLKVGLRLYGHRYSTFSSRSRTDTELVVPIGPLNRAGLLKVIDDARAHGETPLVLSSLQAGDDLKKIGGGTIVLVTDGEESCGGNPRQAGKQLAALGVPLRLDIIGFTLTGSRIAADMQAFAGATGGRFYTAANGVQLQQALVAATAAGPRPPPPPPPASTEVKLAPPEDYPYEIFNAAGEKVATGSTLNLAAPDLEAGVYRVVLHDGTKSVSLADITVQSSQTVELIYSPVTGTLQAAQ